VRAADLGSDQVPGGTTSHDTLFCFEFPLFKIRRIKKKKCYLSKVGLSFCSYAKVYGRLSRMAYELLKVITARKEKE
jgi:hypothetical protein